jgi:hypothetical protein
VLDDGARVGSDKVLDGLGHAVFRHESSRLGSSDLGSGRVGSVLAQRDVEQTPVVGVVD